MLALDAWRGCRPACKNDGKNDSKNPHTLDALKRSADLFAHSRNPQGSAHSLDPSFDGLLLFYGLVCSALSHATQAPNATLTTSGKAEVVTSGAVVVVVVGARVLVDVLWVTIGRAVVPEHSRHWNHIPGRSDVNEWMEIVRAKIPCRSPRYSSSRCNQERFKFRCFKVSHFLKSHSIIDYPQNDPWCTLDNPKQK